MKQIPWNEMVEPRRLENVQSIFKHKKGNKSCFGRSHFCNFYNFLIIWNFQKNWQKFSFFWLFFEIFAKDAILRKIAKYRHWCKIFCQNFSFWILLIICYQKSIYVPIRKCISASLYPHFSPNSGFTRKSPSMLNKQFLPKAANAQQKY